jgi:uncharacterized protein (DUF305 family)
VRTTAIRGTAAAVLLTATVLGLAGCVNAEKAAPPGAGSSQSYAAAAPVALPAQAADQHNQADITFLDQAVRLRQQAVSIAGLAAKGSTNAMVRTLATKIAGDTVPPVDTMTGWLTQWSQPAPASVPGQVPGLLTDAQVQQLGSVTGTPFDMQWLQGIHGNLAAAAQAAGTEAAHGSNPQAKQLAQEWATQLKSELAALATITG